MKNFYLYLFCVLILPEVILSQRDFTQELIEYRNQFLPEKVFVHTDKEIYLAGEPIWLAAYLMDGQTHQLGGFSASVTIVLENVNHEVIDELQLYAPQGYAAGSIGIPENLPSGSYQLLAYTQYQRNTGDYSIFRKLLQVADPSTRYTPLTSSTTYENEPKQRSTDEKIRLRFFPEGGDCVEGLPCQVVVLCEGALGQPMKVSGEVTDQKGQLVQPFATNEYGLGQINFVSQSNFKYKATFQSQEYYLPNAMHKGYTLNVIQKKQSVQLFLRTNLESGLKDARIIVHHRGLPFLNEKIDLNDPTTMIDIKTLDMAPGVHVATLFDPLDQPVAERLFFVAPDEQDSHITLELDQESFSNNGEMNLSIQIPVNDMIPDSLQKATVSLSILPVSAHLGGSDDIRTWLLVNSDLDDLIPNTPDILFAKNSNARDYLMNQYLLTRGWRRFVWKKGAPEKIEMKYDIEEGLMINGQMSQVKSPEKGQDGKVFLSIMEDNMFEDITTDKNGNFEFGPYLFYGEKEVILQGRYTEGGRSKRRTDIDMSDKSNVVISLKMNIDRPIVDLTALTERMNTTISTSINDLNAMYEGLTKIELDEVEIVEKANLSDDQVRQQRTRLYSKPSFRLVIDSVGGPNSFNSIRDIYFNLPGVNVVGGVVRIQGPSSFYSNESPSFFIDGVQVDQSSLSALPIRDIDFVDVLRGGDAALFGTRGGTGVILFYTRQGVASRAVKSSQGILNTKIEGYHKAREFAIFENSDGSIDLFKSGIRTLYWNPEVSFNEKGNAEMSFGVGAQSGKYLIIAQGLRNNGQPLFGQTLFTVQP